MPDTERSGSIAHILQTDGLKTSIQNYTYDIGSQTKTGNNVYAVLHAPRGDATEAMVLMAAWRNMDGDINTSGVALVLSLARYFKRWSIWSKDIIIIISSDSTYGPQAWVDAYHDTHNPDTVSSLDIKAGALQAAVAVDYTAGPWGHRFDKLHIVYDGVNGQLPNLDLFNTAVNIANGHMGITCAIQQPLTLSQQDDYQSRLEILFKGMLRQAVGHASGPHSSFMPYHIDAITLQAVGDGNHDEISLGRVVESTFRSVNNLLEHLHQSFFFYLLMNANRFVSIGTYLPSAMLIAGSFSITAIFLWVKSGISPDSEPLLQDRKQPAMTVIKHGSDTAIVPTKFLEIIQRDLFFPLSAVFVIHVLGLFPLYIFNQIQVCAVPRNLLTGRDLLKFVIQTSDAQALTFMAATLITPAILATTFNRVFTVSPRSITLIHCFSLLLLGAALSTLATLNFSQALFIGLLASPLSFVRPFSPPPWLPRPVTVALAILAVTVMVAVSPPAVLMISSHLSRKHFVDLLTASAWAWKVEKVWTVVTVWIVWWPAWVCGSIVLLSGMI